MEAAEPPGFQMKVEKIFLITVDCLRGDVLSEKWGGDKKLPVLHRLAVEGMFFERCFAASPWTLPSIKAILTGRYPSENRGTLNLKRDLNIFMVLKAQGFKTAAFCTNSWILDKMGYMDGVDEPFFLFPQVKKGIFQKMLGLLAKRYRENLHIVLSDDVFEKVKNWASFNSKRKFFAWIHLMDAHQPYMPLMEGILNKRFSILTHLKIKRINQKARRRKLTLEEIQMIKDWYIQGLQYIDQNLGLFLDELEKQGILEDTLVIVTGDHGHAFFEHGIYGHGRHLYNEFIHVPLIIYSQGLENQRISKPVSLVDLPYTIARLAGSEYSSYLRGDRGVYLFEGTPPDKPVFSEEEKIRRRTLEKVVSKGIELDKLMVAVVHWPWKLILHVQTREAELFNLEADFEERRNLISKEQEVAAHLRREIQSHLSKSLSIKDELRRYIARKKLEEKLRKIDGASR